MPFLTVSFFDFGGTFVSGLATSFGSFFDGFWIVVRTAFAYEFVVLVGPKGRMGNRSLPIMRFVTPYTVLWVAFQLEVTIDEGSRV
jgi:hypothetical protein